MLKAALEKAINEDMAEIWSVLSPDEKRIVTDNLQIHTFKKNQLIYAEGDEPEFLWCLFKGKVKKTKEGVGGRVQILRLIRPVQYFGYRASASKGGEVGQTEISHLFSYFRDYRCRSVRKSEEGITEGVSLL